MQSLTAWPREDWTAGEVKKLLVAPDLTVTAGCDLLDETNAFVTDISKHLAGGTIEWGRDRAVHRTCRLSLLQTFDWTHDRFRPWMELSSPLIRGGTPARFHLGVFILTSPDDDRGEDPQTWRCSGSDRIQLLQTASPGDTHVAAAVDAAGAPTGLTYLDAIRDVLTASGVGGNLQLTGAAQTTTLPSTRVWCLSDSTQPSWLHIINDLLREINYVPLYADENGVYRSQPRVLVAQAPVEWAFDTSNLAEDILGQERQIRVDQYNPTNVWRFVNRNHGVTEDNPAGVTPTEDNGGVYVVDEFDPVVHLVRVPQTDYLDVPDAAGLVERGTAIVAEDKLNTRTIDIDVDPLPIAGHGDVVTFTDLGRVDKVPVASWSLDLSGARTKWLLGGGEPDLAERTETQAKATITNAAPLQVVTDGAETDSLANALDAATYTLGQRVTVTVRNPLPPLIHGEET